MKNIGYIILSCTIVVLTGALVFILLQPNRDVEVAKPTDTPAKVYDLDDIFNNLSLGFEKNGSYYSPNLAMSVGNLHTLDERLPVTKLSKINDDLIYAVYDVQQNSIGYNMYIFFERGKDYEGETAGQITADNFVTSPEKWSMTGQILFMNKTLSFADFSSLQIGDSVEKAEAIDPVVSIPKEEKSASKTYFHSKHLLTDGSLVLVFSRDSTDEDFTLTSIEYDENFLVYGTEQRIRASDYANK